MKFENLGDVGGLAIVGATGLVGQEMLDLMSEYKIHIPKVKLLASQSSAGQTMTVNGIEQEVEILKEDSFKGIDVAFFSVPNDVTRKFVPAAIKAGALVIDDSSTYRLDPNVALIVPEVNGAVLRDFSGSIISVPNCTTTPLVMALKPLEENYGIERVVVSTYQSVSGAGKEAYEELSQQTASLLNGQEVEAKVFPHRIAFNLIPQIGEAGINGNTSEEEKIIKESRKILDLPELRVASTAIRVPTFFGHGLSVNVELQEDFGTIENVREILDAFPGVKVLDNPSNSIYPTNVESTGTDYTFIGRIRRDSSVPFGLNFWVIADNLRKGAALNALQCVETLYRYRRMS